MHQNKIEILSTRPIAESSINAVAEHIRVDIISFIETTNCIDTIIEETILEAALTQATIVFTSMNAAEAVINLLEEKKLQPDWSVYCLGGTTKKILANYFGEEKITGTANNANDLAEEIISKQNKSVVFFCGNIRRDELPQKLKQHHVDVNEIVVYQTKQTAQVIDKNYHGILFFSPSAVESFFSLNQLSLSTIAFAIGSTTADMIKKHCTNPIIISDSPEKEILLQTAVDYFKQIKTQA
jgi:uroporphyrinogen-III synthase